MSIPFVYFLESKDGHIYVGSKIGKGVDPKILWSSYFSSSNYVKNLIKERGKDYFSVVGIEVFSDPEEAFWKEQYYIESLKGSPMLLNKHSQKPGTKPFSQFGRTGEAQYLFGKGYLRSGKLNPMFGKQGAMKGVVGKDHPAYGKDKSGERNGMFGVKGELHHHYGTPPWEVPISKKLGTDKNWLLADEIYDMWKNGISQRNIAHTKAISLRSVETMCSKFKSGWKPDQDPVWLSFVEEKQKCVQ